MPHKDLEERRNYLRNWKLRNRSKVLRYAAQDRIARKAKISAYAKIRRAQKSEELKLKEADYRRKNRRFILQRYHAKKDLPSFKAARLVRDHRRRALLATSKINLRSIKQWITEVKSKQSANCYYCGKRIPTKLIHFDHIVPLSKGGPHSVDNLCVSCSSCNLSKSTKSVQAFIVTGQQILSL
jgi:5-methylcytosine-specific restriction endonuclease McrA